MIHVDAGAAIRELKRLHRGLSKDQTNRAIALAFNSTLSKQRTFLRRHIQRKYPNSALQTSGYGQGKGIRIGRATRGRLYATMTVSSKSLPLRYYGAKQIGDPAKGQGVSIEVTKGRRKTLPFAFTARVGKSEKNKGTFQVLAKGNYPGGGGFDVRTKRIRKKGNDLGITALVGPAVGTPDPSIWQELQERTALEVPKQLAKFFDKIAKGVVK